MSVPDSAASDPSDLNRCLAELGRAVEARQSAEIIQLPLWPEPKRGTPNSFLRSALFSAIQSKDRQYLEEVTLASQGDVTVKFTGRQLNQEDLTVWETLVHLARQHPLGNTCEFTAHGLLKALGLPTGGAHHRTLHSAIIRLTACAVQVTHGGKTYFGSLIESGAKDELTHHYVVKLNRDIIRLYGASQWTAIDWQQRQKLRRKPLAQALHAYFSTHRNPYPVTLGFLQKITSCKNAQAASFKRQCRTALNELVRIGFLQNYSMDGDRVTVKRTPTALPPQT
jgi:hypothetical protein